MRLAFRHRLFNKQGAAERIGGIARVPLSFRSSFFARLIKNGASNEPSRSFFSFFFRLIVVNELYQETWEKRLDFSFIETSERERDVHLRRKRFEGSKFFTFAFRKLAASDRERERRRKKNRAFSTRVRRLDAQLRLFELSLTSRVWCVFPPSPLVCPISD